MSLLSRRTAIAVFLAFALAYFISALVRAVTATLAPALTVEFGLGARDLGLLAGGYFLGFAATQLPLGSWLDRYGPRSVILCFLAVAVAGCAAFSLAGNFASLMLARVFCGIGVSACLMAPLTGFRRWLASESQLRANSWLLMTGSMGMVASTLPVQWLLPVIGWRPMFLLLALLVLGAMAILAWKVPRWEAPPAAGTAEPVPVASYAQIRAHPFFRRMVPVGFFSYGGLLAVQTLWAGPWMTRVAGYSPLQAATGLFWINVSMLAAYSVWGLVNPWLARRGLSAEKMVRLGLPASFALLALLVALGPAAQGFTAVLLALYCVGCTFISLAQPAVGMAFPAHLAGRALSAYNLVIFSGVFAVQWGIGLAIDAFQAMGLGEIGSFRLAFCILLACSLAAYASLFLAKSHNPADSPS